jgi:hypothetical protein
VKDADLLTTESLLRLRRGLQSPDKALREQLAELALGLERVEPALSPRARRTGAALTVGQFSLVTLHDLGVTVGELFDLETPLSHVARGAWRRAVEAVPG